jgi:hypothetical protein
MYIYIFIQVDEWEYVNVRSRVWDMGRFDRPVGRFGRPTDLLGQRKDRQLQISRFSMFQLLVLNVGNGWTGGCRDDYYYSDEMDPSRNFPA